MEANEDSNKNTNVKKTSKNNIKNLSSGTMESSGAVDIFKQSIIKRNLIYKEYVRDDDTSSFNNAAISAPYLKHIIKPIKFECIGHAQKWYNNKIKPFQLKKSQISIIFIIILSY